MHCWFSFSNDFSMDSCRNFIHGFFQILLMGFHTRLLQKNHFGISQNTEKLTMNSNRCLSFKIETGVYSSVLERRVRHQEVPCRDPAGGSRCSGHHPPVSYAAFDNSKTVCREKNDRAKALLVTFIVDSHLEYVRDKDC